MSRKGTRYVIKVATLPIVVQEHKSAPVLTNFKDKKKYFEEPPPAVVEVPAKVAPANEGIGITEEEFYGTLDQERMALSQKKLNVRVNQDLKCGEVAKLSRKIGKGLKFINFVKETVGTFDATKEQEVEDESELKVANPGDATKEQDVENETEHKFANPGYGLDGAKDREGELVKESLEEATIEQEVPAATDDGRETE